MAGEILTFQDVKIMIEPKLDSPTPSEWGKTWRITPKRRQQYLWLWACSKHGEKLVPFIFNAIHERVRMVIADRIKRGKKVEQWVTDEFMAGPGANPSYTESLAMAGQPFQDAKNDDGEKPPFQESKISDGK